MCVFIKKQRTYCSEHVHRISETFAGHSFSAWEFFKVIWTTYTIFLPSTIALSKLEFGIEKEKSVWLKAILENNRKRFSKVVCD